MGGVPKAHWVGARWPGETQGTHPDPLSLPLPGTSSCQDLGLEQAVPRLHPTYGVSATVCHLPVFYEFLVVRNRSGK